MVVSYMVDNTGGEAGEQNFRVKMRRSNRFSVGKL
jgi:hypothetical protein